jgi:hypothetical protein
MTHEPARETARIYQFPVRARQASAPDAKAETRQGAARTDAGSAQIAYAACGSGWYHDAAIQETEPARKP